MSMAETRAMCVHIAEELEAYAAGHMYRCPVCGEINEFDDINDDTPCPNCGAFMCDGDGSLSVYDWLEDVLDIEYRVTAHANHAEYRSARVLVTFGGPNIYVDTGARRVELYWWNESNECPINSAACAELDAVLEEIFNC